MPLLSILLLLLGLGAGATAGRFVPAPKVKKQSADDKKDLEQAKKEAEEIREQAKERARQIRASFAEEEASLGKHFAHIEENLKQKEDLILRREQRQKEQESTVESLKKEVVSLNEEAEQSRRGSIDRLAKASGMTEEKALKIARDEITELVTEGKEVRQKAVLEEMEEEAMRHAKAVLQIVIQRLSVPSSVDKNSTTVVIKSDQFKGLLIGKDGNNIKYLESLLPVAVIFNLGDPKNIHVGGLNLLRRNIAKRAIQKMQKRTLKTRVITHELIDETVAESEKEVMDECDRKGKWAFKQMGLDPSAVPEELVNYVGRMYFRTSYGQNIIHHSLEMAYAARLIAEFIGADANIAMQAAFYHDIGKAIDHDVGGAHDDLSKEILEKHGFDPAIVHAAYAHHDKVPCEAPADFIVKAVDAISGGRPGARMESVTNYFERMKQLEATAKSFPGVSKVQTMSAGREVRVIVNKDSVEDGKMSGLAEGIAEKISEELAFPGIIKVNLIRQTKSVDYAREKQRYN